MSLDEVELFLIEYGFDAYIEAFRSNGITTELLPDLSSDELKEIGVLSIGHRKQILAAIREISGDAEALESSLSGDKAAPPAGSPNEAFPLGTKPQEAVPAESVTPTESTAQDWINKYAAPSPTIRALRDFVELDGEVDLGTVGQHVITNYRLVLVVDDQPFNIPLADLKTYTMGVDGRMTWTDPAGQPRQLSVSGTIIKDSFVLNAMTQRAWLDRWSEDDLGPALKLMRLTRSAVQTRHPEAILPTPPSAPRFTSKSGKLIVMAGLILAFLFICCGGLSDDDDSSRSSYNPCQSCIDQCIRTSSATEFCSMSCQQDFVAGGGHSKSDCDAAFRKHFPSARSH